MDRSMERSCLSLDPVRRVWGVREEFTNSPIRAAETRREDKFLLKSWAQWGMDSPVLGVQTVGETRPGVQGPRLGLSGDDPTTLSAQPLGLEVWPRARKVSAYPSRRPRLSGRLFSAHRF